MKQYPPVIVATCVVPWTEKYELDEARFRRCVRDQLTHLTKHLYVFGTAGEGYAVSDRQFEQIVRVFWDELQKGGGQGMLGVISLSLRTIIERIELGKTIGFRHFQISLPSWGILTDRELDNFFQETCGRFPDCKFLHYNLPRTKRVLTADEYARISPRHPNLVAVKMGGGKDRDKLVELVTKAPNIQFFFGGTGYALIRDEYECGHLISVASTNHEKGKEFTNARGEKLRTMLQEMDSILDALMKAVEGVGHMDGVFDKFIWKLHDPSFPLRLLPPYTSGDEETFKRFRDAMPKAWLPEGQSGQSGQ